MEKKIFKFKIVLDDILPQIWRLIEVESDITFYQFHLIIQEAMGWTNSHLHEFSSGGFRIGDTSDEANEFGDHPQWEERERKIGEYFSRDRTRIDYQYDFGDNWEHTIMLEAIENKKKSIKYPRCINGARACSPEDCGSSSGYYRLLEILSDPKHEEYEDMKMWAGEYDPEYFNKKEATERMRNPLDFSDDFEAEFLDEKTDVEDKQRWDDLPEEIKNRILDHVYCTKCSKSVRMVDYKLVIERGREILRGKCVNCSNYVVRVLD